VLNVVARRSHGAIWTVPPAGALSAIWIFLSETAKLYPVQSQIGTEDLARVV